MKVETLKTRDTVPDPAALHSFNNQFRSGPDYDIDLMDGVALIKSVRTGVTVAVGSFGYAVIAATGRGGPRKVEENTETTKTEAPKARTSKKEKKA
jgi:hypothetical protein